MPNNETIVRVLSRAIVACSVLGLDCVRIRAAAWVRSTVVCYVAMQGTISSAVYGAGGVVSAVCHGPVGLVPIKDPATGKSIVDGKRVRASRGVRSPS